MLIDKVKAVLRIAVNDYDAEINKLIEAAFADLGIVNINPELLTSNNDEVEPLIERAIMTFCKMNFGYISNDQYQKFKASYDEQKSQLLMSSAYTDTWGDSDA